MNETKFRVGDEVLRTHRWVNTIGSIGKVVKVTPTGIVKVKFDYKKEVEAYNPDGYMRGNDTYHYTRPKIVLLTPELKQDFLKRKYFEEAKAFFNTSTNEDKVQLVDMTYIIQILNNLKDDGSKEETITVNEREVRT